MTVSSSSCVFSSCQNLLARVNIPSKNILLAAFIMLNLVISFGILVCRLNFTPSFFLLLFLCPSLFSLCAYIYSPSCVWFRVYLHCAVWVLNLELRLKNNSLELLLWGNIRDMIHQTLFERRSLYSSFVSTSSRTPGALWKHGGGSGGRQRGREFSIFFQVRMNPFPSFKYR